MLSANSGSPTPGNSTELCGSFALSRGFSHGSSEGLNPAVTFFWRILHKVIHGHIRQEPCGLVQGEFLSLPVCSHCFPILLGASIAVKPRIPAC